MQNKLTSIRWAAALCLAAFMFSSIAQAGPMDSVFGRFSSFGSGNRIQPVVPSNSGPSANSRQGADDPANHNAGDNRGVNPQPGDDRGHHGPGHR